MTKEITSCHVPPRLPPKHAAMYQNLRKIHCANKREAHECQGRICIDKNGVTATCPLCGDHRSVNPPAEASVDQT